MTTNVINAPVRHARSSLGVWGLRILLALIFLYVGVIKLPGEGGMWVRLFDRIGLGQWFRYFTAAVEMIGGTLMLVPRATPVAVLLTASVMVGALIVHAAVTGFGSQTVVAVILLASSGIVGWSYLSRGGGVER